MQVLVSYSERNQIFTVSESGGTKSLKVQVSKYFGIAADVKILLQRFDTEWETFIDLDDDTKLKNHDRVKVTILPSSTIAEELPTMDTLVPAINDQVIPVYVTGSVNCYFKFSILMN